MILADSGIVTGAFTLGGVVITALAAYWIDWRRQKREDRTRWDKERLLVYSEFLTEERSHFLAVVRGEAVTAGSLGEAYSKASLLASPDVGAGLRAVMTCHLRLTAKASPCIAAIKVELGSSPRKG